MSKGWKMSNSFKWAVIGTTAVVVIGVAGFSVYAATIKNEVAKWENKIYPGVKVDGVDLSGKTKEEAIEILNRNFSNTIKDKKLLVKALDKKFELDYSKIDPQCNVEEAVDEALKEGKNLGLFKKNSIINNGANKDLSLNFKYDEEKLKSFEQDIESNVNKDFKNASIRINSGQVSIQPEEIGYKINVEELDKLIKDKISGKIVENAEIDVNVEKIQPTVTKDALSKINGNISSFSTDFSRNSTAQRATNVTLATNFLNGKLLMPGETFSYNQTVGERTAARGFQDASIFVGDKVEQGIGGGICQVSTTLYRAVMRAGIKSTERINHSMPTSYSPLGLDATVVWGALDYKFKNSYDFPIYIEAYTSNQNVIINLYGNVEGMGGKTYELYAETLEQYQPNITKVNDSNLADGQTQWDKQPVTGYKVKSYLVTYQNGKEINRENIATDTYRKVDGVMKVGIKKTQTQAQSQTKVTQPQVKQSQVKQSQTQSQPQAAQSQSKPTEASPQSQPSVNQQNQQKQQTEQTQQKQSEQKN
ncbi:exported protein [Clostridium polyendosporum]|uniref:Exported protein n=1 Tax=Clostridium polyendosporum TaxID=69208 RepID=A0A919S1A8_9CLOT|nr:VanW family protein [Clostridium polyendosporum]GIM29471.1 exported protein [Clostridium polyendosporum]